MEKGLWVLQLLWILIIKHPNLPQNRRFSSSSHHFNRTPVWSPVSIYTFALHASQFSMNFQEFLSFLLVFLLFFPHSSLQFPGWVGEKKTFVSLASTLRLVFLLEEQGSCLYSLNFQGWIGTWVEATWFCFWVWSYSSDPTLLASQVFLFILSLNWIGVCIDLGLLIVLVWWCFGTLQGFLVQGIFIRRRVWSSHYTGPGRFYIFYFFLFMFFLFKILLLELDDWFGWWEISKRKESRIIFIICGARKQKGLLLVEIDTIGGLTWDGVVRLWIWNNIKSVSFFSSVFLATKQRARG